LCGKIQNENLAKGLLDAKLTGNFIEQYLTDKLQLHFLAKHVGYSKFHFHIISGRLLGNQLSPSVRIKTINI